MFQTVSHNFSLEYSQSKPSIAFGIAWLSDREWHNQPKQEPVSGVHFIYALGDYLKIMWKICRDFLFAEVAPHSLAAFRILFGLYLFGYFLSFAPHVNLVFSNEGVLAPYLIPDWSLPPILCTCLYIFMLSILALFITGWRTALITPTVFILYSYFYLLNIAVKNTAHERLNWILLGILCLAKLDGAWSIRKQSVIPSVSIWPIRMVTMQICFIYFGAGVWKLCNPKWHTGDLLYHNFFGIWATPVAFWIARLGLPPWFWTGLSWTVIVWELMMPFALLWRRTRIAAVISGILFHLSVVVLLYIPEFLNCIAAYVLFFDPEQVRNAGNRIFGRIASLFGEWSKE